MGDLQHLILLHHPQAPLQRKPPILNISNYVDLFHGSSINFLLQFIDFIETKEELQRFIAQNIYFDPLQSVRPFVYLRSSFRPQDDILLDVSFLFKMKSQFFIIGEPPRSGKSSFFRQCISYCKMERKNIVIDGGTGTALGDPIEVQALEQATGRDRCNQLVLGHPKTNYGHCETAGGDTKVSSKPTNNIVLLIYLGVLFFLWLLMFVC